MAIIKALEHWRPYLAGSPRKIKIFSDHMNLQYWHQPHKISRQVVGEVLTRSEYDIEIHHIKGKANSQADALSQQPNYDQGDNNNQEVTVLQDKIFVCATTESITNNAGVLSHSTISLEEMMINHPVYEQNEYTIAPWIEPHGLKRIQDTWYKDG